MRCKSVQPFLWLLLMCAMSCSAPKWYSKADCPNPKTSASASWGIDPDNNLRIYAIGGYNQTQVNNLVDGFNVLNNSWQSFSPMLTKRTKHAAVTYLKQGEEEKVQLNKKSLANVSSIKIYVFGGVQSQSALSIAEVYDTKTDTWRTITPMEVPRYSLTAALGGNGRIYVFGGENGFSFFDTVEEYDPLTDTWTRKNPMPGRRAGLAATTGSDGMIYLSGGTSGPQSEATFWRYDPGSDSYTELAPMPSAVSRHDSVAGFGDEVFVLGPVAYQYDITNNVWSTIDTMNCGYRIDAAAEYFLNSIYLIGGYRRFNPPLNCLEVYTH